MAEWRRNVQMSCLHGKFSSYPSRAVWQLQVVLPGQKHAGSYKSVGVSSDSSKLRWCREVLESSVGRQQEKVVVLSWWEDSGIMTKMRKYERSRQWGIAGTDIRLEANCTVRSCKGLIKDGIGHQVITLTENLNPHCANNTGSRFYYNKKENVLLFILRAKVFFLFQL